MAVELIDEHIYSDGALIYVACKSEAASLFDWGLFLFSVEDGKAVPATIPGSIVGFLQSKDGTWYLCALGNPKKTEEKLVLYPFANFENSVMSHLEHQDDTIRGYLFNENFRGLMQGMGW